jgi:hypothetical protein
MRPSRSAPPAHPSRPPSPLPEAARLSIPPQFCLSDTPWISVTLSSPPSSLPAPQHPPPPRHARPTSRVPTTPVAARSPRSTCGASAVHGRANLMASEEEVTVGRGRPHLAVLARRCCPAHPPPHPALDPQWPPATESRQPPSLQGSSAHGCALTADDLDACGNQIPPLRVGGQIHLGACGSGRNHVDALTADGPNGASGLSCASTPSSSTWFLSLPFVSPPHHPLAWEAYQAHAHY